MKYLRTFLDKYGICKYRPTFKQDSLFIEALHEAGIAHKGVKIDHENAICYNGNTRYKIVFPLRLIKLTKSISTNKKYKYCFVGIMTAHREWVEVFNGEGNYIKFTNKGRLISKDSFDLEYYQVLAKTQFTLCPRGDYLWSYRFFEAIICHSIPIVESTGIHHPTMKGFKFYLDKDIMSDKGLVYDPEICQFNYNLLLERHTFLT